MKHKHHDAIVAWAGGAEIQHRAPNSAEWKDNADPAWVADYDYRVKPAEPERPMTMLSDHDLHDLCRDTYMHAQNDKQARRDFANIILRHAIDAGQVVTREEFDRAIGDRAARDLAVSIAVRDALIMVAAVVPNVPTFRNMAQKTDLFAIIDKVKA